METAVTARRFIGPAVALLAVGLLAAMVLTTLLAPWLGTVDPQQIAPATRLRPPCAIVIRRRKDTHGQH